MHVIYILYIWFEGESGFEQEAVAMGLVVLRAI